MEAHASYPALATAISKYPRHAQSLFQAYNDILYSQQWSDVEVQDLPTLNRSIILGRKEDEDKSPRVVVPCSLLENLSMEWFSKIFAENPTASANGAIWTAIVSDDSSLVYYKISQGVVKPPK